MAVENRAVEKLVGAQKSLFDQRHACRREENASAFHIGERQPSKKELRSQSETRRRTPIAPLFSRSAKEQGAESST